MKLSLCLLIILVVCSYEANATQICEAVAHESISFLLKNEIDLKNELEMYNATSAAVEAKLEVKSFVDKMSYEDRFTVAETLAHIFLDCGVKGWVDTYYPELNF
ncbi:prostatic steroid-binding protein C1-like [Arvicanthis niloticus]|uniref:prostatic steroid-binding protein C1-like n=1 Tax=Arvicanthis niloticus TaxID=61156 RepID=UPI001485F3B4|nr:prostatic steroid-binding protein C1-like [Arvicanthis niloticus]